MSCEQESANLQSCEKAQDQMAASWPQKVFSSSPDAMCHSFKFLFCVLVNAQRPSAENAQCRSHCEGNGRRLSTIAEHTLRRSVQYRRTRHNQPRRGPAVRTCGDTTHSVTLRPRHTA